MDIIHVIFKFPKLFFDCVTGGLYMWNINVHFVNIEQFCPYYGSKDSVICAKF